MTRKDEPFAFDEFRTLVPLARSSMPEDSPTLRYVSSLVAELCYYHVPQFEIDRAKRAKLVPCEAYQEIVRSGQETNVLTLVGDLDFSQTFVIVDRNIIAVGILINDLLFVGLRGTLFCFEDWLINLNAGLAPDIFAHDYRESTRFHRGFLEEAIRIGLRIRAEVEKIRSKNNHWPRLILCGHSLGGAVAAICNQRVFGSHNYFFIIFGAPRYANLSAIFDAHSLPVHIRRPGDIVPMIPPRWVGYVDCPNEYLPSGAPAFEDFRPVTWKRVLWRFSYAYWRWSHLASTAVDAHKIFRYRSELGEVCGAQHAKRPLIDAKKL